MKKGRKVSLAECERLSIRINRYTENQVQPNKIVHPIIDLGKNKMPDRLNQFNCMAPLILLS